MARSRIVGSRELKTRLGHYLQRVRRGETILVTDRHEPVAELRPVPRDDRQRATLQRLAAAGMITLPTARRTESFTPIQARGATGSDAIAADRAERG
jgi:prevent-host-death family protein